MYSYDYIDLRNLYSEIITKKYNTTLELKQEP